MGKEEAREFSEWRWEEERSRFGTVSAGIILVRYELPDREIA